MCYVYMLSCRGGRIYTGYTTNFFRRLQAHQLGKGGKFTRAFAPVRVLVCWKVANNPTLARQLEYYIKRLSRKKKLILANEPKYIYQYFPDLVVRKDQVVVEPNTNL